MSHSLERTRPAGEVGRMIERLQGAARHNRNDCEEPEDTVEWKAAAMLERLAASDTEAMRLAKDLPLDVKLAGAEAITVEHMKAKANYDAACDCWDAMAAALRAGDTDAG